MRSVEIPGPGGRVYNVDLPDDAPDVDGATVVVELLADEVHVQAREAGKPGSTYEVLPSGALAIYGGDGAVVTVFGPAAWKSVVGDERVTSTGGWVAGV